jgi:hypothetical protein
MDSNQRYALPYRLESVAVKWLGRYRRDGSREPVGHGGPSALMPKRDFLGTARTEKSDITLQALCHRPLAERAVKANTSVMRSWPISTKSGPVAKLAQQVAGQLMAKDALDAHARDELGLDQRAQPKPIQAALASAPLSRSAPHRRR